MEGTVLRAGIIAPYSHGGICPSLRLSIESWQAKNDPRTQRAGIIMYVCYASSLDLSTMPQTMSTHCSIPSVPVSMQMS